MAVTGTQPPPFWEANINPVGATLYEVDAVLFGDLVCVISNTCPSPPATLPLVVNITPVADAVINVDSILLERIFAPEDAVCNMNTSTSPSAATSSCAVSNTKMATTPLCAAASFTINTVEASVSLNTVAHVIYAV